MRLRDVVEAARGLVRWIYPNACLICGAPVAEGAAARYGLCDGCRRAVGNDPDETCARCASTVGPHSDVSNGCTACRARRFAFERAVRLGRYDGALRVAILRMKVAAGEPLAETLGQFLADSRKAAFAAAGVDVVVPVPLHWRRRWSRGYNQAEAIAHELALALGVECRPGWLRRAKPTPQRAQPSASARQENIRGAFRVGRRASLRSRTVLLVDDVMTTGSTVNEAARVLLEAGATKVIVGILARA